MGKFFLPCASRRNCRYPFAKLDQNVFTLSQLFLPWCCNARTYCAITSWSRFFLWLFYFGIFSWAFLQGHSDGIGRDDDWGKDLMTELERMNGPKTSSDRFIRCEHGNRQISLLFFLTFFFTNPFFLVRNVHLVFYFSSISSPLTFSLSILLPLCLFNVPCVSVSLFLMSPLWKTQRL